MAWTDGHACADWLARDLSRVRSAQGIERLGSPAPLRSRPSIAPLTQGTPWRSGVKGFARTIRGDSALVVSRCARAMGGAGSPT